MITIVVFLLQVSFATIDLEQQAAEAYVKADFANSLKLIDQILEQKHKITSPRRLIGLIEDIHVVQQPNAKNLFNSYQKLSRHMLPSYFREQIAANIKILKPYHSQTAHLSKRALTSLAQDLYRRSQSSTAEPATTRAHQLLALLCLNQARQNNKDFSPQAAFVRTTLASNIFPSLAEIELKAFIKSYPKDKNVPEAQRRLKKLAELEKHPRDFD